MRSNAEIFLGDRYDHEAIGIWRILVRDLEELREAGRIVSIFSGLTSAISSEDLMLQAFLPL